MKLKHAENNILISFALSLCICIASAIAVAFVFALIANASENSTENIPLFALASLLVSAAISGVSISRMRGAGGVKFSALVSLTFVLILLLISVIVGKGSVPPSAFMNYASFLGVTTLAAYLGRKKEGKRRKHRR